MTASPWLEQLRSNMRQQGLPPAYVERLVVELSDHADQILEETESMDAERILTSRLGAPEQLAVAATTEFRRQTFAGRHPILIFAVGPLFVVLGSLILTFILLAAGLLLLDLALGGLLGSNDELNLPPPELETAIMLTFNIVMRIVPFALSALLFTWLSERSGQRGWGIVGCSLVAIIAFFFSAIICQATADQAASWQMGFGCRFTIDQPVQAVIPVALAVLLYWRRPARQLPSPVTA